MQLNFKHPYKEADAVAHVKKILEQSSAQIAQNATDVEQKWEGNVLNFGFSAQGTHITGVLTVKDYEYDLYAKLPLALRLFEGRIEKMIQAEAAKMLT